MRNVTIRKQLGLEERRDEAQAMAAVPGVGIGRTFLVIWHCKLENNYRHHTGQRSAVWWRGLGGDCAVYGECDVGWSWR